MFKLFEFSDQIEYFNIAPKSLKKHLMRIFPPKKIQINQKPSTFSVWFEFRFQSIESKHLHNFFFQSIFQRWDEWCFYPF